MAKTTPDIAVYVKFTEANCFGDSYLKIELSAVQLGPEDRPEGIRPGQFEDWRAGLNHVTLEATCYAKYPDSPCIPYARACMVDGEGIREVELCAAAMRKINAQLQKIDAEYGSVTTAGQQARRFAGIVKASRLVRTAPRQEWGAWNTLGLDMLEYCVDSRIREYRTARAEMKVA